MHSQPSQNTQEGLADLLKLRPKSPTPQHHFSNSTSKENDNLANLKFLPESQTSSIPSSYNQVSEKKKPSIPKSPDKGKGKRRKSDLEPQFIQKRLVLNNHHMKLTEDTKQQSTGTSKPQNSTVIREQTKQVSTLETIELKINEVSGDGSEIHKVAKSLLEQNSALQARLNQLESLIREKEVLIQTTNERIIATKNDQQKHDDFLLRFKRKCQDVLIQSLLEVTRLRKQDIKSQLAAQRIRLGECVQRRDGNKFTEMWIDGSEMLRVKQRLCQIGLEKVELEKEKKIVKSKGNGSLSHANHHSDSTIKDSGLKVSRFESSGEQFSGLSPNEDNKLNVSKLNTETKPEDIKDRINSQLMRINREEAMLKEELERMEMEKTIYILNDKRQFEEDQVDPQTLRPVWPLLNNRYQVLSLLGKGGFSEVYTAFDVDEMREVACKIHQMNPNWSETVKENYIKHALRETEIHKALSHPNIVRLFDTLTIDVNSFATILERCDGPDLSYYLKTHKCLPEKEAKALLRQIVAGLKYLHEQKTKVIHYDLKPHNIFFHKGELKISDFGLCKVMEPDTSRMELTSQGVGTYWYLPPETFRVEDDPPQITPKVDVWSLGVIFYEMLLGQRPFGHGMSQDRILKENIILKSTHVSFPIKPIVSQEAKDFIRRCLSYKPEERFDVQQAYNSPYLSKK